MEYTIFRPTEKDYAPRHLRVELEDVRHLKQPAITAMELTPPSNEYLSYTWQREAAMASLRGIHHATNKPGLHRRQESFLEIARDEINTRWRRVRTYMGSLATRLKEAITPPSEPEYGGLDILGFTDEASREEAYIPVAIPLQRTPAEKEWLTPLQASNYFTPEELDAMRRAVEASHQPGGTVYDTNQEYADSRAQ